MLEIQHVTVRYGDLTIVNNASVSVREGQWLMLAGPNGAGKSTLVGAISQGVPYTGSILYEGQNLTQMKPARIAQNIGILAQSHSVAYSFSVEEIVKLGRYSYSTGVFGTTSDEDQEKIDQALEMTGLLPLRNQSVMTLSGGELQRTFLAQIFAQDPNLLILDEPTNHLDLVFQKQIFELIGEWLKTPGRAVVSVVHDLSLARAYGSHALLLSQGTVVASGPIAAVLTRGHLQDVYGIDVYYWMQQMLSEWKDSNE